VSLTKVVTQRIQPDVILSWLRQNTGQSILLYDKSPAA
jgi:hypothetical protein